MRTFLERLAGAAFLNAAVYEKVESDPGATRQAAAVVFLSSLAAGIGLQGSFPPDPMPLVVIALLAFGIWAVWAFLTFQIGTRIMPAPQTRSTPGELLRTIGFASAPGILRVFALIPGAAIAVFLLTALWMLAAMVVAVQHALDYTSTARAVAVCGLGWILAMGLAFGIGIMCSPPLH